MMARLPLGARVTPATRVCMALAAATLAAAAGCVATPEASREDDAAAKQFDAAPGSAIVYLYRSDFPSGRATTTLWLDGRLIGRVFNADHVVKRSLHGALRSAARYLVAACAERAAFTRSASVWLRNVKSYSRRACGLFSIR